MLKRRHKRALQVTGQCMVLVILILIAVFSSNIYAMLKNGDYVAGNGVDLGQVKCGTVIKHVFHVWNLSLRKQSVAEVVPSCTCSVSSVAKYEIPPLCCTSATLKVNSGVLTPGQFAKGLIVRFTDGHTAEGYVAFTLVDGSAHKLGKH